MNTLFDIGRPDKASDQSIAKKSNAKAKKSVATIKGGNNLLVKISQIKASVEQNLKQYKEETQVITTTEDLRAYFEKASSNCVIAIDTETTGLDPLQDSIAGLCIYTPGLNPAYVPINHKNYITNVRYTEQLTAEQVADELNNLIYCADVEIIMANAKFDIRVIRNQLGVRDIYASWDCLIASKLLNENEVHNNLKYLHNKYCLDGKGDAFRFDDLFKGITFDLVPYSYGAIYAAHDAKITYELYKYQEQFLGVNGAKCEEYHLQDVRWVYENIEMPCIKVVADIEDTGVAFDFSIQERLADEYHKKQQEALDNFYDILNANYSDVIQTYRLKNPNNKLGDPINVASPTQLAILLYDIIGVDVVDKKSPRGTGVDILEKIDLPITKAILEYRTIGKLVSTYIDKLPKCVNPDDGRIHCSFNQYGAVTGRFSSENPNLQNIPSHNKDIRQMFKATDGYVLMSADYSQQENSEFVKVEKWCEVDTPDGFKYADKMQVGDKLKMSEDGVDVIVEITKIINPVGNNHLVYYYK